MTYDNKQYHIERDLIDPIQVPINSLYDAQTQRAIELYPLNGEKPLSAYPQLIEGMLRVKKIAALTNIEVGKLSQEVGQAIINAADLLLCDLPADQYTVHAFNGGGGISTNMNINEVIANLANRNSFHRPRGSFDPLDC